LFSLFAGNFRLKRFSSNPKQSNRTYNHPIAQRTWRKVRRLFGSGRSLLIFESGQPSFLGCGSQAGPKSSVLRGPTCEAKMKPELAALLRTHFSPFLRKAFRTVSPADKYLRNWHIDAIMHQLNGVTSGNVKRLIINQPPRSLKSISISVAYVAWRIGRDPTLRVIVASYSAELAADLHRQFRMVVQSAWYRELFPRVGWEKETILELPRAGEAAMQPPSVR
jgi:hypothetical protein